ncbi:PREDICTED: phosphoinositide phosphatase SAC8 isoform X2 [Nelumbo nucifera]|uniref:Phosphoinositide phosphatase SAC8 isoform X2 n=1 Tax=Nelumbo nucifera TaxID=4432 RepID=A0A1U7ZIP5_NELNU|nr:PREDICTED: phosphoinositide phosphatase SAC8 isoform X2 [Nelumbo nucifera]
MENITPSGGFKLFNQLQLQEFPDKFIIRSTDSPEQAFSIGRSDGVIEQQTGDSYSQSPTKVSTIYGVVGTIRLLAGTYVLIITSRKEVGSYLGFPIFRVMSMRFLSCNDALQLSTAQEKKDEAYFITLLKAVESTPGLYYSYETDLTLNLQRTCNLAEGRASKPLWKQADPRFVWNRNLLDELIECKLDAFIIPLVQGSFQTAQFTIKSSIANITLVSRRCTRRLGTRMWRRGANLEGDTANFIETEQLFEFEGFRSSFLQIRGSIPLLWEQIVDLSYKPRLRIINHEETPKAVERHFHDLTQRYGETVAVDLTDKHGDEGQLSMAYASEMEKLPHVRYVSFDFHHYCGNSNFDNLQLLYDQISVDVEKQGYFLVDSEGKILMEQKGAIRVNCIDCLDRTNVTQSYLAQKSLNSQLQRLGALSSTECISKFDEIYEKFKTVWIEQGDEISLEYSGTHALKRDLVRFGKQTFSGLIKDGMSALSRYYLNNFHDGIRQDAMDLISGHYTVNRNNPSPFQLNGFESLSYLPVASALLVGGLTLTSFTLNQAGRNAQHFASSVLWAGLTAGVMALVKANGRQFCSRPRLCGLL